MYRIKDLREDNDIKQKEMAKYLSISQAQYSNIENGISDITGEKLIKLCKKFNVSADYILGLINEERKLYKMHK